MTQKQELDLLLNAMLPFAHPLVEQHGEFYPFGGILDPLGKPQLIFTDESGEERPPVKDVLARLIEGLVEKARKHECRATAVCVNSRIARSGSSQLDAILVSLEHVGGMAVEVAIPYSRDADGTVSYGSVAARAGGHGIFRATH